MQKRPIKITDPALKDTLARLETFSKMLARRVSELSGAFELEHGAREASTLALLEAEVAVGLVESAAYEVSLRLLAHGVVRDADKDIAPRLKSYRSALGRYEATFGSVPRA